MPEKILAKATHREGQTVVYFRAFCPTAPQGRDMCPPSIASFGDG